MSALTGDRNTPRLEGDVREPGVAAAMKIFAGALVCLTATGYAAKGSTALNLRGLGMALEQVDNSAGAAGDLTIRVREGVFRWSNSAAGDAITIAEVGKVCYVVDDQTVAKTSGAGTRSPAGIVAGVDANGVHVLMGEEVLAGYLANNKVYVEIEVQTLVGANSYFSVAPVAGRITKLWSVIEGVLTTGDASLTAKINGAAITAGALAITQAGSAAGDVDSAAPTAANVVAAGDALAVTVGGTNATASKARVVIEITRD